MSDSEDEGDGDSARTRTRKKAEGDGGEGEGKDEGKDSKGGEGNEGTTRPDQRDPRAEQHIRSVARSSKSKQMRFFFLFGLPVAWQAYITKDRSQPVATGLLSVARSPNFRATNNRTWQKVRQPQPEVRSLPVGLGPVSGLFAVHRTGPLNTTYPAILEPSVAPVAETPPSNPLSQILAAISHLLGKFEAVETWLDNLEASRMVNAVGPPPLPDRWGLGTDSDLWANYGDMETPQSVPPPPIDPDDAAVRHLYQIMFVTGLFTECHYVPV
jgi:hypothetical protein